MEKMIFVINRGKESEEQKAYHTKVSFFIFLVNCTLQVQNNNIKCIQIINIELHNNA